MIDIIKTSSINGKTVCAYGTVNNPLFMVKDAAYWTGTAESQVRKFATELLCARECELNCFGKAIKEQFLDIQGMSALLTMIRTQKALEMKRAICEWCEGFRAKNEFRNVTTQSDHKDNQTNGLSIFEHNGTAVLDSREVAEWVEKQHAHLMRDIKGYSDALSTETKFGLSDFFIPHSYKDSTGRTLPCYLITRKGCEMVANKMTGQKGVLFTAAFIQRFHEYEDRLKLAIPQDYPSALRALAETFEKKQQLEAKVEADAPKVLFANAVESSRTSILIGDLAKLIRQNGVEIGRDRLFQWLRNNGYLTRDNMPTQYSMEREWFEVSERTVSNTDGSIRITRTTRATGKGQTYFINKFLRKSAEL